MFIKYFGPNRAKKIVSGRLWPGTVGLSGGSLLILFLPWLWQSMAQLCYEVKNFDPGQNCGAICDFRAMAIFWDVPECPQPMGVGAGP